MQKTLANMQLVREFGGWFHGDIAYFPTPYDKIQYLKAVKERDATLKTAPKTKT